MTSFRADPLLGIARALLMITKTALVIAGIGVVIALPAVLIMQDAIITEVAKDVPKLANHGLIVAMCGLLVAVLPLLGAMWFFVHKLGQIVNTVATGDPFIPENARRLQAMAWTSIALQFIGAPVAYFAMMIPDDAGHHGDVDVSLNGVLLAVVLFILARVFRTGAAMREELEGMV